MFIFFPFSETATVMSSRERKMVLLPGIKSTLDNQVIVASCETKI